MSRYTVKLTRFEDQDSFAEALQFLVRVFPEREEAEIQRALVRLPCLLSHDASETAARALEVALCKRGARIQVAEVQESSEFDPSQGSQEVDADFLLGRRRGHSAAPSIPPQIRTANRIRAVSEQETTGKWDRLKRGLRRGQSTDPDVDVPWDP